jgi:hypothetical protein
MTALIGSSTTNENECVYCDEKRSDARASITSFARGKYKIEGLADIFGIVAKAFAVFIPLPAVAFATGAILAEGGTSPEIIEEKIDGIKNSVTDKVKKENATEKQQRQQGQDQ